MKTVCDLNQCVGCMACVDICPKSAISIRDNLNNYNAVIDEEKCSRCNVCNMICQQNNTLIGKEPIEWYQGWAKDENIRIQASSGGIAGAISRAFIEDGGIVYSCVFEKGKFIFSAATNIEDVKKFAGSKYVKSSPVHIYKSIYSELKHGKKVLFIGLPCQVGALKTYIDKESQVNLFTIDLICHGTPSPRMLDVFLAQYGKSLSQFEKISFRVKAKMQIYGDNEGIVTKGVSDRYTIAFLNALTYIESCYACRYANLKRVSDMTIGDSWGSTLSVDECKRGISLILCQTRKGLQLLQDAPIDVRKVDKDNAILNNGQLRHPAKKPRLRNQFFASINSGKNFNLCVFKIFPMQCLKQDIKRILIYMGIIQR